MGSLSYRLGAERHWIDSGSICNEFNYISAFKHSKIKGLNRRMTTGRALHLLDPVSYLNSAHTHCCIRFPTILCMRSRTQVTFSTFCLCYLVRLFPLQTTGNLQQKKCSVCWNVQCVQSNATVQLMFFSISGITEEACHNSDFAHLLSFKMVHASTQNYLSYKVNQFLGWEL